MTADDRQQLAAWKPGRDRDVDCTIAQLLLDKRATADTLEEGGVAELWLKKTIGTVIELPAAFDDARPVHCASMPGAGSTWPRPGTPP